MRRFGSKWGIASLLVLLMMGASSRASAAVLTFTPPDSDIEDLDHTRAYAWKMWNINLGGQAVQSATLSFNSMYNWDSNPNELYLHLLDTARNPTWNAAAGMNLPRTLASGTNSRITYFQDATGSPVTDIDDAFISDAAHNYLSNPGWLVAAGTADTFLTSRSFAAQGQTPTTLPGDPFTPGDGWSYTSAGGGYYNYTYTFSASQLTALQSYITNGQDVAIGLDPDCHYFNNGITFQITTGTVISAVPEPGSLLLLGSGLFAVARRFRRQRAARSAENL